MNPKSRSASTRPKSSPAVVFTAKKGPEPAPEPPPAALVTSPYPRLKSNTIRFVGAPHPPRTHPAWVEILRAEPLRAHDRLAEIVVDASFDPGAAVAKVEDKLCKEAAKIGADAAVVVYDGIQPGGSAIASYWDQSAGSITGRKLVGIAIKYHWYEN